MRKMILGLLLMPTLLTADFRPVRNLTVMISHEDFGGTGRATGVLIDSTHVLTCAHVLETERPRADDEFFIYSYPLGKVIMAHPDVVDSRDDLAILVLDSSVPVVAPAVFQENVSEGDAITVIGNALGGMKWLITHGIVSEKDKGFLLTDALVNPGNSGGPWVNEKGEIVALTDWRIGPQMGIPGLVGGIPAEKINKLLFAYFLAKALQNAQGQI
jgi:putative serine protease PepD